MPRSSALLLVFFAVDTVVSLGFFHTTTAAHTVSAAETIVPIQVVVFVAILILLRMLLLMLFEFTYHVYITGINNYYWHPYWLIFLRSLIFAELFFVRKNIFYFCLFPENSG